MKFNEAAAKARNLEKRGLYRRAAECWRSSVPLACGDNETELAISGAKRCSLAGRYSGKTEDMICAHKVSTQEAVQ